MVILTIVHKCYYFFFVVREARIVEVEFFRTDIFLMCLTSRMQTRAWKQQHMNVNNRNRTNKQNWKSISNCLDVFIWIVGIILSIDIRSESEREREGETKLCECQKHTNAYFYKCNSTRLASIYMRFARELNVVAHSS